MGNHKKRLANLIGVFKSFKTGDRYTTVLKKIDLQVDHDEFIIVFGPSGCGKSTLLHSLIGLERPDSGQVIFGGMDIWTLNSDDRASIRKNEMGIMYQHQNWIKSLTVIENLSFVAKLTGLDKDDARGKAKEALETVGMSHRSDYIPSELSAGEQQKIGLGRALMGSPSIIIADEPTGNLDVTSGDEVMDLLKWLNSQEGKAVVMVTHNPDYLRYADKVVLMLDGQVRHEVHVTKENIDELQQKIAANLRGYIESVSDVLEDSGDIPDPLTSEEEVERRNIFQWIKYSASFIGQFVLHSTSLVLLSIVEKIFGNNSKLSINLRSRFESFIRRIGRNSKNRVKNSINTMDIAEISFKNLKAKRSRTIVTVLGMAIGIGFIVFLLSIGYGLEKLVVNEVAKIEDLRQVDVIPAVSSRIQLTKDNLAILSSIEGVESAFPIQSLASKARYQESSTDVATYGVEAAYLLDSIESIVAGKVFDNSKEEIVVNRAFLETLGKTDDEALGVIVNIEFVFTDAELPATDEEELEGEDDEVSVNDVKQEDGIALEYTIVGVVDDGSPPLIYVPLEDTEELGIAAYSQLRVILDQKASPNEVRQQIEVLGFETSSVVDTIAQVEELFGFAKVGLAIVGLIALSISVLGMFNTLTVSLMERTREVGLMKTIGTKADEIRGLFINEAIMMSTLGAILGLVLGFVFGSLLSLAISVKSLIGGGNIIIINNVPWSVVLIIMLTGMTVGFITGLYPSSRAVKIAPLDALRYE